MKSRRIHNVVLLIILTETIWSFLISNLILSVIIQVGCNNCINIIPVPSLSAYISLSDTGEARSGILFTKLCGVLWDCVVCCVTVWCVVSLCGVLWDCVVCCETVWCYLRCWVTPGARPSSWGPTSLASCVVWLCCVLSQSIILECLWPVNDQIMTLVI